MLAAACGDDGGAFLPYAYPNPSADAGDAGACDAIVSEAGQCTAADAH
jgi:hypothetical protein